MSENMRIYDAVRSVPPEAKKDIPAGRLKGKTEINPMWRIKVLTEMFGVCGIGWKYEIARQWVEPGGSNEIAAFTNILLYIKDGGEWSAGIPGNGGATFVASEKNGLYVDDECYKKSLTDAISVSCKALGIGADVYWDRDSTKYDKVPAAQEYKCEKCDKPFEPFEHNGKQYTAKDAYMNARKARGAALCRECFEGKHESAGA